MNPLAWRDDNGRADRAMLLLDRANLLDQIGGFYARKRQGEREFVIHAPDSDHDRLRPLIEAWWRGPLAGGHSTPHQFRT